MERDHGGDGGGTDAGPGLTWLAEAELPAAPQGRVGHTTCVIGNRLWVFGGYWRYGHCLEHLHYLNLSTLEWGVAEHPFAPEARTNHAACLITPTKWLIFGGFNGAQYLSDLHVLNAADPLGTVIWERDLAKSVSGTPPAPRQHCSMSRVGSRVYIFGGYSHGRAVGDLCVLDLSEYETRGRMAWLANVVIDPTNAPPRRDGHLSWAFAERYLAIFGGYDNMVYTLDTAEGRWLPAESMRACPVTGQRPHYRRLMYRSGDPLPAVLFGGEEGAEWGVLVGGVDDYENTLLSDAWALDFAARQWRQLVARPGGCPGPPDGGLCGGGFALHYPMGSLAASTGDKEPEEEGDALAAAAAGGGAKHGDDCAVILLWGGERKDNDKHQCLYVLGPSARPDGGADARLEGLVARCAQAGGGAAAAAHGGPCRACGMCCLQ
eukprot:TRINITY_DN10716_c0_g1_i2.p1 TRINITY_DN10716_c0_g1~~TRINITY_DN10716_c0_g1_i2.p1  ORF type:complete len:434 (+),score=89.90 TRINITY_DN10716_c0_g1_i2:67-1368(+)